MNHKSKYRNLLLVEDNPGDARLIKEYIGNSWDKIETAPTVAEARKILSAESIHMILLDLGLPDSKGFNTFKEISEHCQNIPIIILTGYDDEELAINLLNLGVEDYLVKSKLDEYSLKKAIEYAIERFSFKESLKLREEKFKELIVNNADGMLVLDQKEKILYLNPTAEKLLNVRFEEIVGDQLGILLDESNNAELNVINSDSEILTLQIRLFDSIWENMQVHVMSLRDITELKAQQLSIDNLNALLKTIGIVNHLIVVEKDRQELIKKACNLLAEGRSYNSAWIGLYDEDGKITIIEYAGNEDKIIELSRFLADGNRPFCEQRLINGKHLVSIDNTSETCGNCPLAEMNPESGSVAVEISYDDKSLGVLVVSRQLDQIINNQEEKLLLEVAADLGLALHTMNIEERDRAARKKLLWLNEALRNAANAVMLTDNEGVIEWINPAFSKLTGYSIPEAVGKSTNILNSGMQPPEFYRAMWNTLTSGKIWNGELINKKKDGTLFTEEMTISPVLNENGKIEKYIAIKSDITEKKRAQKKEDKNKAVTETLFELSNMVEQSEDEIIDLALEKAVEFTESVGGYLHFMNDDGISLKLFKWSKKVNEICTAEKIDHYPIEMAGIWADCVRLRQPVIHNDYKSRTDKKGLPEGHFELLRHVSVPIYDGEKIVAVCGVGNKAYDYNDDDVVRLKLLMNEMWKLINRKKINQALQQNEQQFRSLFENATVGIYRTTAEGELLMANPRMINMLKYNSFEEMKNSNQVITGYVNPEDRTEFMEIIFNEGVVYGFESTWKRNDGSTIDVRESARIIVDSENEGVCFEGTVEDITEVKKTELELIEAKEQAEHSDKLKTQFLAQISHEIRTPVNTIVSFADLMKDTIEERGDDELLLITNSLDSASQRLIRSIELILNMSELQLGSYEPKPKLFDLKKEILYQVVKEFESTAKIKNLELKLISNKDNLLVYADSYSVMKILQNLVDNSIKYTEEGFIQIEYSEQNDRILLEVKDSGIGISEEYQSKLFSAFSQEEQGYSRSYDGTGLGLALVKKYCDINKIEISVESVKGKGTNFKLLFPPVNK